MSSGRLTLFDSPLLLGFDHLEKTFDRISKAAHEGYPPYNIEQTGENTLRISIAVAGFSTDDMDVEIDNNQLSVRGKQTNDRERFYLHRGIAARQFKRSFILADGMEVRGASLTNGLLHIDLEQVLPQSRVQKITISSDPESSTNAENVKMHRRDSQKS